MLEIIVLNVIGSKYYSRAQKNIPAKERGDIKFMQCSNIYNHLELYYLLKANLTCHLAHIMFKHILVPRLLVLIGCALLNYNEKFKIFYKKLKKMLAKIFLLS